MPHFFSKLIKSLWRTSPSESTLCHYYQLRRLCNNHQSISIKTKNQAELFQSLILKVDEYSHELLIDDLFPNHQKLALKQGDTIQLISQIVGQELKFYTRVIQRLTIKGKTAYRLELPKELGHNHNRRAFRVYVDTDKALHLHLGSDDTELNHVKIANLSINGIKLHFAKDIHNKLSKGLFFDRAVIQLPNGYNIDCTIEIKNHYLLKAGQTRSVAGGNLIITNPQHKKKLQLYLATVQRQQRRRDNRVI